MVRSGPSAGVKGDCGSIARGTGRGCMGGVAGGVLCAEEAGDDPATPFPPPIALLRRPDPLPDPDPMLIGRERPVMEGVDGVEGLPCG